MAFFVAGDSNQDKVSGTAYNINTIAPAQVGDMFILICMSTDAANGYQKVSYTANGLLWNYAGGGNNNNVFCMMYQHRVTTALAIGQTLTLTGTQNQVNHVTAYYHFRPDAGESFDTVLYNDDASNAGGTGLGFAASIFYDGIAGSNPIPAGYLCFAATNINSPTDTQTMVYGTTPPFNNGGLWTANDAASSTTTPISFSQGNTGGTSASNTAMRVTYKIPNATILQRVDTAWSVSAPYNFYSTVVRVTTVPVDETASDPMGMMGFFGI